jgi:ATP-binding cassette subfamily B protein
MTFIDQDKINTKVQLAKMIRGLWPYTKKHPGLLFVSVTALLGYIVIERALPFLIGHFVDQGFLAKNSALMLQTGMIYLALQLLKGILVFLTNYGFARLGNKSLRHLRLHLFSHVESLQLNYFHRNPTGRLLTRMTNDPENLREAFSGGVISLLMNLLIVLAIIISLLLISWKLTFITLSVMPLFIWAAILFNNRVRVAMRTAKQKLSAMNAFAAERLQGVRLLQLLNQQKATSREFLSFSNEYGKANISSIRNSALLHPVINLATAFIISLALISGGILALDESLALGQLIAFLLHTQDIVPPLREFLERYQQFQNSITSAERVFPMFQEQPESSGQVSTPLGWDRPKGHLLIKDLWFSYQEGANRHSPASSFVFRGLNLEIKPKEKVGIVGRTGIGKSTLIALLQRFFNAPPNSIFLDGVGIEQIPHAQIRRWIGVVLQDPFLFQGTLRENLVFEDQNTSDQQIIQALMRLGGHNLLQRIEFDLNYKIQEKGANLSAGERQLICFARIILFDPPILILDEATAQIDIQTEKMIQKCLLEVSKDRTVLIIAHRLSTLEACDRVIKIEEGQALQQGPLAQN